MKIKRFIIMLTSISLFVSTQVFASELELPTPNSKGRLEYDQKGNDNDTIVIDSVDLQNITNKVIALETTYKEKLYEQLRMHDVDLSLDINKSPIVKHTPGNNYTASELKMQQLLNGIDFIAKSGTEEKWVLFGQKFWSGQIEKSGQMANNTGLDSAIIKPTDTYIPATGYHDGKGEVKVSVADATAVAANVLTGNSFYAGNGTSLQTGTMVDKTGFAYTFNDLTKEIELERGLYNGNKIAVDIPEIVKAAIYNPDAGYTETKTAYALKDLSNSIIPSAGKIISQVTVASINDSIANVGTNYQSTAPANVLSGEGFWSKDGYVTGSMPNNGVQIDSIKSVDDSITIKQGYHNGSGKISVSMDEMIVSILNSSTYSQEETVTPDTTVHTITPDTNKVLKKVTVNAIKVGNPAIIAATTTEQTITPTSGNDYMTEVKIAGIKVGNPADVTPGKSSQVITPASGNDYMTSVTVKGDANLLSENIKDGVSIFGVTGSLVTGSTPSGKKVVINGTIDGWTPEDGAITISPEDVVVADAIDNLIDDSWFQLVASCKYHDLTHNAENIEDYADAPTTRAGWESLGTGLFNNYSRGLEDKISQYFFGGKADNGNDYKAAIPKSAATSGLCDTKSHPYSLRILIPFGSAGITMNTDGTPTQHANIRNAAQRDAALSVQYDDSTGTKLNNSWKNSAAQNVQGMSQEMFKQAEKVVIDLYSGYNIDSDGGWCISNVVQGNSSGYEGFCYRDCSPESPQITILKRKDSYEILSVSAVGDKFVTGNYMRGGEKSICLGSETNVTKWSAHISEFPAPRDGTVWCLGSSLFFTEVQWWGDDLQVLPAGDTPKALVLEYYNYGVRDKTTYSSLRLKIADSNYDTKLADYKTKYPGFDYDNPYTLQGWNYFKGAYKSNSKDTLVNPGWWLPATEYQPCIMVQAHFYER